MRTNTGTSLLRNRHGRPRFLGDVLVAVCTCALTVAIVGSAVYLTWTIYNRHQWRQRVRGVVASLQNRTPEELEARAAQLKALPKLAKYVLPEIRKALREAGSEAQICSAVQIARGFVDDPKIRKALFRLRKDSREGVAAAAVEVLRRVEPPQARAEILGKCLAPWDDAPVAAAVVDEVCAGLLELGEPGRVEMGKHLGALSAERRYWLVGYVDEVGGPYRETWLAMLASDSNEDVRSAANDALRRVVGGAVESPAAFEPSEDGPTRLRS